MNDSRNDFDMFRMTEEEEDVQNFRRQDSEKEQKGFRLEEEPLLVRDRKKILQCAAILAAVFIVSYVIWPMDISNFYLTNAAVEKFVQGLFSMNGTLLAEGGKEVLLCMLRDLAQIGRAFLTVIVSLVIMKLTVLRKKKTRR